MGLSENAFNAFPQVCLTVVNWRDDADKGFIGGAHLRSSLLMALRPSLLEIADQIEWIAYACKRQGFSAGRLLMSS
jgi:hypothetical protein